MEIWKHMLLSSILALVFYPFFKWSVLLILISGVAIDIDHYLWRMYKNKEYNPLDCYRYYLYQSPKNNFKADNGNLHIFHTTEFLAISVFLSFYSTLALLFTIGLLGHYILDAIWHVSVPKRVILNHSLISWIIKNTI